ncbi:nitroreductase [Paenibacillus azoreducens]|uniref:nitroreductase n=1 Tax=Paenibacillus azoreducens TaxID=116718 RepID=UPI0039F5AC2D
MLDVSRMMFEGFILSAVFLFIVLVSLAYNPRIWLQDYPKDIQNLAAAQTPKEQKQFKLIGAVIFAFALVPFILSLMFDGEQIPFRAAFGHFYVVFTMVSLSDLVVLDWVIFCLITPRFIIIPGTHGAKGYKDVLFHFIGFLKGQIIFGVVSLILAGLRVTIAWL